MAALDAAAAPGPRPGAPPDNCPFCLEPLAANSLVLECGHCFHSRCCVQFLLKRKQCPCCRAPVRAEGILDAGEVPDAAAGKQFCPPSPRAAGDPAVQIRAVAAPPSPRQSMQQQAPARRVTRSATAAAAAAEQARRPPARALDGHSRHAVPVPMSSHHSPIVAAQLTAVMPPPGTPPPPPDDECAPAAFARAALVVGAVVAVALIILVFVV